MALGLLLFARLAHFTSGPVVVLVLALMLAMAILYRRIVDSLRQRASQGSLAAKQPSAVGGK